MTTNPTDAQMKLADFKAEWRKDMSEREIEALAGRMRANPEIKAPCQGYPGGIPWETHMRAYEVYCAKYRGQVAMIDLFGRGCRGGFAVKELDAFIPGWRDELSLIATLNARIQATEARAQGLVETLEACSQWMSDVFPLLGPLKEKWKQADMWSDYDEEVFNRRATLNLQARQALATWRRT